MLEPEALSYDWEGDYFEPPPEIENWSNVQRLIIPDSRQVGHEAFIVSPPAVNPEPKQQLVLIIGGIARGTENQNLSPLSATFTSYAQKLAANGVASLVMNPAGIGDSQGDTWRETLLTRIGSWDCAVQYAIRHFNVDPERVRIIGNSMGGHIGLRLIARLIARGITVDRIALLSPFFYGPQAERARFGPAFTLAIRKQVQSGDFSLSWSLEALYKFQGRVWLGYARDDEPPIPAGMQSAGYQALQPAIGQSRAVVIGFDRVKHNLRPMDESNPVAISDAELTIAEAANEIVGFLS